MKFKFHEPKEPEFEVLGEAVMVVEDYDEVEEQQDIK